MVLYPGLGLLMCLASCKKQERAPTPAASHQKGSTTKRPSSEPARGKPSASATHHSQQPAKCRAIGVRGSAIVEGGEPIRRGDALDGRRWLTLEQNSEVVVRHADSSREYALIGPAHALPCRAGAEEVLLETGELRAAPGGGARAGALVLVATPLGLVSYGNAGLTLRATSRAHDVQVQSGSAWLEPGAGAKRDGKAELIGPKAKGSLLRLPGHTSAGAVEACEQAANQALELAKRLLGEPPSTGMGDAAAEHMRLRSKARQACLVAEAGLGLAKEPGDAKELRERVARANERWQRVPSRSNQGYDPEPGTAKESPRPGH